MPRTPEMVRVRLHPAHDVVYAFCEEMEIPCTYNRTLRKMGVTVEKTLRHSVVVAEVPRTKFEALEKDPRVRGWVQRLSE